MREFVPPKLWQRSLYWTCSNFMYVLFRLIWRLDVEGRENLPETGGVLLASNHQSLVDPPLVGCCIRRHSFYFAKEELFHIPLLGWFLSQMNAFPVRRFQNDIGAFRKAQGLLKNGQVLVLFPEGGRSRPGEIRGAKRGVGMMAYLSSAPVIPVYVDNSAYFLQFRKLNVVFGTPVQFPEKSAAEPNYQEWADRVVAAIADLRMNLYNRKNKDRVKL